MKQTEQLMLLVRAAAEGRLQLEALVTPGVEGVRLLGGMMAGAPGVAVLAAEVLCR